MVEDSVELDDVFHALANRARRQMLGRLNDGPLTVGQLAEPLSMTLAAISKHIKVLERAGLVRQSVVGRQHLCHLDPQLLASAVAWLNFYEVHWEERLDVLADVLTRDSTAMRKRER
jgi:DNA-binding transcriptional ArsR family regulator